MAVVAQRDARGTESRKGKRMSTAVDEMVFVDVDLESEIPCDAAGADLWPDTPGPARWAARHKCPNCDFTYLFLICDDCKDMILSYTGDNLCAHCNHIEPNLTGFFSAINPI